MYHQVFRIPLFLIMVGSTATQFVSNGDISVSYAQKRNMPVSNHSTVVPDQEVLTVLKCPTRWCRCSYKKHLAICTGHNKNLSVIPELPPYIQKVRLDNDYFPWLTKARLKPIVPNNVTMLSLQSCYLHHVDEDAFQEMLFLENLDLGTNVKVNVSSLKMSLGSLQKMELDLISFDRMRWNSSHMSLRLFVGLQKRYLNRLTLTQNIIESLPVGSFSGLEYLERLDLQGNKLKKCENSLLELKRLTQLTLTSNELRECNISNIPESVEKLILNNNSITSIPMFCSAGRTVHLSNLSYLILDDNNIKTLGKGSFDCLPNLKHLSLKYNSIDKFPSHSFTSLKNLKSLHLSKMKKAVHYIGDGAFAIPSLVKLNFRGNGFHFFIPAFAKRASLSNCTNLETLDLSENYMPKWPEDARNLLGGLTKLKTLHLIDVKWNLIPDQLFKLLPNVKEVELTSNGITTLNNSLFSESSKISVMYLDSNKIAHVGPNVFTEGFWKSVRTMDMSGNPFACDCDLLWFIDKIKKSNVTFKRYPRQYNCLSPPKLKGVSLSNFNLTAEECEKKSDLMIILLSSGSFVVFALITVLVIYQCRWHIRYWIYLLRYRKTDYTRLRNDDFLYDGFIIYSDDDSEFVHKTLLEKLEDEHGYRMCVHFRDFEVGKIIVDNIVESMSSSRQALVIVSKPFCESRWCKFELLLAQDRWLRNESEALVIVMLDELESRHMTKDLRALIKTTTYCKWTGSDVGQELFWEQLLSSLKKDIDSQ